MRRRRSMAVFLAAALLGAQPAPAQPMDPDNPTCPASPNWSTNREMRFTVATIDGRRVLIGEGLVDDNLLSRLQTALAGDAVAEVRLRSPGGNARVGTQAGRLIRQIGLTTRIPAGWACMGSCAFMFMGGIQRVVEPDGLFIVQMFTVTGDRAAIQQRIVQGGEVADALMTDIARQSAQQASEDNDYLIQMGVSRRLLSEIVYRQQAVPSTADPSTRRCLTQQEMRRYNVVTTGP